MDFVAQGDVARYFPVESQTGETDKRALIGALLLARSVAGNYRYLEVGSFMGGSLAPFLMDPHCVGVLSVDDRGRAQADERGLRFDYAGVSAATMIHTLQRAGLDTAKLATFDGSIDAFVPDETRFDVAFIDAEHTDEACFRDALWTRHLMQPDSMLLFHDSRLVWKALRLLAIHLRHAGVSFDLHKKRDSDITALLFGAFRREDVADYLGEPEDFDAFSRSAEAYRIETQLRNRARIDGLPEGFLRSAGVTIGEPRTVKAY